MCEVPTAGALFPEEILYTPRKRKETNYNLIRWTRMPDGGHFAALEQQLVDDIRVSSASCDHALTRHSRITLMRHGTKSVWRGVFLVVVLGVAALSMDTQGQSSGADLPRLSNGRPNLNGIWQALSAAHYDIERHIARPSMMLREGPHGPLPAVPLLRLGAVGAVPGSMGVVEGGTIPYTPEARALKEENQANWVDRDPEVKCYVPGVPRATYMPFPFQIFQSENDIFVVYEYANATREIYMDYQGPAPIDSWMGQSDGRWEGDTLVVDVTGQNEQTWFDRAGSHHTNQLRVEERYTMTTPNHIQYEATIEDPGVFTQPWTISLPLYRRMEPDARLIDFRCVEFVEELLFGEYRRNPLER